MSRIETDKETRKETKTHAIVFRDVQAAADRLAGVATLTPVFTSRTANDATGTRLFFKCENLQRGGAFKFRGAYNRLVQLDDEQRRRGVVAYSSGNHAQGVALAARLLGIEATIAMPTDAPASKRAATEAYGAQVHSYDRQRERREEVAARLADERGLVVVPSYDDPAIMAGQGTVALELLEQVGDLDVVITPLGGGGLLSGCATVVKALSRRTRLFGVEPAAGDDWVRSLAAGHPVRISPPATIADGVRTEEPGRYTFPVVRDLVEDVLVVDEDEIRAAMRFLLLRMKLLVEPTGALPLAVLMSGRLRLPTRSRVGIVLSGGNADPDVIADVLTGS